MTRRRGDKETGRKGARPEAVSPRHALAPSPRLAVIGGGNMGRALVAGLLGSGRWKPAQITVADVRPEALRALRRTLRVNIAGDNRAAVAGASIVLLAVKPQQMRTVLDGIRAALPARPLVLSIAAGIPISLLENQLGPGVPVVRVMPNTPALIGAGVSAMALGRWARPAHARTARAILATVGAVVSVAEADLDAVTAVSGSGPAYLYYLAEAMREAGQCLGLAPEIADRLVRQTLRGSALLLAQSAEDPAALRQRVTSPGGTTEAALSIFDQAGVKDAIVRAIRRAQERARELASQ